MSRTYVSNTRIPAGPRDRCCVTFDEERAVLSRLGMTSLLTSSNTMVGTINGRLLSVSAGPNNILEVTCYDGSNRVRLAGVDNLGRIKRDDWEELKPDIRSIEGGACVADERIH